MSKASKYDLPIAVLMILGAFVLLWYTLLEATPSLDDFCLDHGYVKSYYRGFFAYPIWHNDMIICRATEKKAAQIFYNSDYVMWTQSKAAQEKADALNHAMEEANKK